METVDPKGFAKCFPRTAEDFIERNLTPEQAANDVESVMSAVGSIMQSVSMLVLPEDLLEKFCTRAMNDFLNIRIEFKKDLKLHFRESLK